MAMGGGQAVGRTCSGVVLPVLDHLRRHPMRSADDRRPLGRGRVELRRHAKVGQLDAALGRQQQVGALDVAVDDGPLLRVQVVQPHQRVVAGGGDG
eukprot:scaffold7544_cov107-Isochrysis_galbana.AAC.7